MKKFLYLALLAIFSFVLPAFAAERPAVPTEPINMDIVSKVVVFNHNTHTKFECESCHHPVDGVPTYKVCSDAGCHDKLSQKDKGTDSYYQIIHKIKGAKYDTCMMCHLKESTPENKKFLTTCVKSACHP